ncbi:MAG TPA: pentapeptide repeat-containing protein [Ktedonobacterales bacterium]|nr:pentapeptide repeat-containing protein [Ktedonobacterales bacterium]
MDETDKIDELNEFDGSQPTSDARDFPEAATSVQPAQVAGPPATDDRTAWRAWWRAQGQNWRIEPEIAPARQTLLAERRALAPDVHANVYPFAGMALTRADVEWLLATHEHGRGPVIWDDPTQRGRIGLDLRGANLQGVNLRGLPLARVLGGLAGATAEQIAAAAVHLERSDLREAQLQGADLRGARLDFARAEGARLELAQCVRAEMKQVDLRHAHLEGASLREAFMEKANLYEAHLEGATLSGTRLKAASLSNAHMEGASVGGARLENAFLRNTHLEGARLFGARLDRASLIGAHLEGAMMRRVHLEGASLASASLGGKRMAPDDLSHIRQWAPDFPEVLRPADLQRTFFDTASVLDNVILGDRQYGYAELADAHWGDANLAVVRWTDGRAAIILGDEREAHQHTTPEGKAKTRAERLADLERAVRANRQLAVALQAQGLNEDAGSFAYRAQVLQARVLRRQLRIGQYLFSRFLDLLAGYGYRPWRSLVAYLLVIVGFAVTFFIQGSISGPHLAWNEALIISLTAFHGRGFFPEQFQPGDPQSAIAAIEAVIGLLIEICFIATFTQRFLGGK